MLFNSCVFVGFFTEVTVLTPEYFLVMSRWYRLCFLRVTAASKLGAMVSAQSDYWPGKKFGLPMSGPRSTPTYLRRVAALAIDWALAVAISIVFFDYNGFATLGVFIALCALGGLILAGSPGHLILRIRIAPIRGGALGVIAPIVRPVLVALVIPALITDDDQRGLHDRLVATILVLR
jgi:hypothetical protein